MTRANPRHWSIPKLKKETAKVLQRVIVHEAKGADGLVECFTCGARKPPGEMQGGHFLGRRNSILFNERNIHPQCVKCNLHLHGNMAEYRRRMREAYGEGCIEVLKQKKEQSVSFTRGELEVMRLGYLGRLKRAK